MGDKACLLWLFMEPCPCVSMSIFHASNQRTWWGYVKFAKVCLVKSRWQNTYTHLCKLDTDDCIYENILLLGLFPNRWKHQQSWRNIPGQFFKNTQNHLLTFKWLNIESPLCWPWNFFKRCGISLFVSNQCFGLYYLLFPLFTNLLLGLVTMEPPEADTETKIRVQMIYSGSASQEKLIRDWGSKTWKGRVQARVWSQAKVPGEKNEPDPAGELDYKFCLSVSEPEARELGFRWPHQSAIGQGLPPEEARIPRHFLLSVLVPKVTSADLGQTSKERHRCGQLQAKAYQSQRRGV